MRRSAPSSRFQLPPCQLLWLFIVFNHSHLSEYIGFRSQTFFVSSCNCLFRSVVSVCGVDQTPLLNPHLSLPSKLCKDHRVARGSGLTLGGTSREKGKPLIKGEWSKLQSGSRLWCYTSQRARDSNWALKLWCVFAEVVDKWCEMIESIHSKSQGTKQGFKPLCLVWESIAWL